MKKLTSKQEKEITRLKAMKDEEIDLTDIPEVTEWTRAIVGRFYRPVKTSLTIRLDSDVLAWLKSEGSGYQTRLNGILRKAMESERPTPRITARSSRRKSA